MTSRLITQWTQTRLALRSLMNKCQKDGKQGTRGNYHLQICFKKEKSREKKIDELCRKITKVLLQERDGKFFSGSIGFMSQLCVSSGNTTKLLAVQCRSCLHLSRKNADCFHSVCTMQVSFEGTRKNRQQRTPVLKTTLKEHYLN